MPPLPSANTSSGVHRSKKRRWTREQLLSQLKMIGELETPLPPNLPPSPPPSRAASPAAGFKRKLEPSSDPDAVKRPRTNLSTDRAQNQRPQPSTSQSHQHQHQPPPQLARPPPPPPQPTPIPPTRQPAPTPSHFTSRAEPCEDGEVREEPAAPILAAHSFSDRPIRRPKKGKLPSHYHDILHDDYHGKGRNLKYSGTARFWSSYPPTARDYKALTHPPPPNSPYHKHGGLIARLELLDALVCFTYAMWNRDYSRRVCVKETWSTIEAFLVWCKQKWTAEEGISDAERAFLGLIWMIEGFIQGRKMCYAVKQTLDGDMERLHESMAGKIATAANNAIEGDPVTAASFGIPCRKAPPMLPSPSSTNSTPEKRDDATPSASNASASRPVHAASRQVQHTGPVPYKLIPANLRDGPVPIPQHVMDAMAAVTEPISPTLGQGLKDLTSEYTATSWCIQTSQQTLNLPVLRRCFPKTWARMMYSTLTPSEEHEPDFEDEEGELYWPDQCITGEGIGWVCLMGKAMIMEYGKAYGYTSTAGMVPKPTMDNSGPAPPATSSSSSSAQPQSSSSSSSYAAQPPSNRPPTSSGPPR